MSQRKIDFIDSLPPTAEPIKTYNNSELAPIYWYDTAAERIIKLDNGRYRYIRSNNIKLLFNDFSTVNVKTQLFINSFNN